MEIGKKKGTEKDDKRTDKQKKDDLHKGVVEASNFVKSGKKDKKEIDEKFNKLEDKYLLKDLKLITDKDEKNGKKVVHVYGKVNPDENGPKLTIEDLTPKKGKVIISLSNEHYIRRWKPELHASAAGLVFESKKTFDSKDFSGYEYKKNKKIKVQHLWVTEKV